MDPLLARLVYVLFRKNVEGDDVKPEMIKYLISDPLAKNQYPISNISRKILQGPEFIDHWPSEKLFEKKASKIQA